MTDQPSAPPPGHQAADTCAAAISTVSTSLRSIQAAALDLRDTLAELQQLQGRLAANAEHPEAEAALRSALEHGQAMINTLVLIGAYEPVSIDLL